MAVDLPSLRRIVEHAWRYSLPWCHTQFRQYTCCSIMFKRATRPILSTTISATSTGTDPKLSQPQTGLGRRESLDTWDVTHFIDGYQVRANEAIHRSALSQRVSIVKSLFRPYPAHGIQCGVLSLVCCVRYGCSSSSFQRRVLIDCRFQSCFLHAFFFNSILLTCCH